MIIVDYDRIKAVEYAITWANSRNTNYYNFENLGGDCTNFASQCIYAGAKVMNYTPTFGWYYNSLNSRSPSWTGVQFLYNFLVNNDSFGPFGKEVSIKIVSVGDLIQLSNEQNIFYHSLVVTKIVDNRVYVSAHSGNALNVSLNSYSYYNYRCIKISGVRKN